MRPKIKAHLGSDSAIEIMLNGNWPDLPYIKVAQMLNKCKWSKLFPDQAHTVIKS
jgi:hypothetical protein